MDAAVLLVLIARRPGQWWWGLGRYVLGPWALRGVPGLRLCKVLGSGHEGGFGLRPSWDRQGLLCVFDSREQAEAFAEHHPTAQAYRQRARECFMALLRPTSSRGTWSGLGLQPPTERHTEPPDGTANPNEPSGAPAAPQMAMATLTRASIRPLAAWRFWRHAAPSQADLEHAPGCLLAVGLGEAPLLRQATFSIWQSVADMERYAHSGAHQSAIRAAYQGGFFSESMFTRFAPLWLRGTWKGAHFG
jgi:hypothetical protein